MQRRMAMEAPRAHAGARSQASGTPSRALIEALPHCVVLLDARGDVVDLNAAARTLLGCRRAEVIGEPLARLLPTASHERIGQLVAAASHAITYCEQTLRTRAGPLPVRITLARTSLLEHRVVVTIEDASTRELASTSPAATGHFRELTESLPQLVWSCLPDGRCDWLNRRWVEFTGVAHAQQLGLGWLDQVHRDDTERIVSAARRAMETDAESAHHVEFRLRRHDGAYRWFDGRAVPLRDDTGRILKWVGANTEIHASRELRERLRAEQERLASVMENSPGVVISYERDARGDASFSYVSAGATALYGYTPAQITADVRLLFKNVHQEDLPHLLAALAQSESERVPLNCEFRYLHPSEGEKWLEARATPRFHTDGRVVWCALVTDTGRRKRAEEALALTRAQLESALEAAGMGAWLWDYERNMVWGSEVQRRMWQVPDDTPSWFSAAIISMQTHPEDVDRVMAHTTVAVDSGQRVEEEYRIRQPDGSERWIVSRGRVVPSAEGRSHRLAGINVDVTQEKLAAEQRLRSQKLEALGTLAGGIAHDFNNVLFAIGGNAALALHALSPSSKVRAFLDQIVSASDRATGLVRQILAFSRPEPAKREVRRLGPSVQEALRLVRATIPAHISIEAALDPVAPAAQVDATRLVQIVVNLCTNSAHAIGEQRTGRIEVRVDAVELPAPSAERVPKGRYAVLSVRDDGCGIDASIRARIFDPFFTTKPPSEGTGLGLSVVQGIVRALGGHLTVVSQPGEGTSFRLFFPAVEDGTSEPMARASRLLVSGRGQRVMFVDDERALVALGAGYLEALGYRPTVFQDPHEALRAFRHDPQAVAAVITDLAMPSLSGFELVRSMLAVRPELPVLMLSGFLGPSERAQAAKLGIRELVLKPVALRELGDLLARIC